MLQGAIIGAIAGLLGALLVLVKQSRRGGKLLDQIAAGRLDAARHRLDRWAPPVTKVPLGKILPQAERMAGLTLLGDARALDQELAGHTGHISAVSQVGALGLLGLGLVGSDRSDAARRLGELSVRVDQEGGRALAAVKRKVALMADLARAVAGHPLDDTEVSLLDKLAARQGKLARLIVWQALAEALEVAGKPTGAAAFSDRVRQSTRVFDPS